MQITIEIPEEIGQKLQQNWHNLPQKILEVLAIESYKNGMITTAQIQELLHFSSRWETETFLKNAHVDLDYTEADLAADMETLNQVLSS
ncbi:MAG: UPF0175 family protein [Sphaerospermopsis kisseleviana]|jgi:hypothetical protein|uniref:Uncharacterized protein n=3 Tax=Sphaerospermopsis TaxID=752201 RepID=A0A480A4Z1_9CYAN|nr:MULTISPECIES: UPF0175 family protein [Sphaerospermopsis]BAZ83091.1 hypothetical protein NIES73_43740 [Sphaerospermopsis kisseleviana NIES-73]MBC5798228.1 UPF0175 family protein [Sphaerospermopsis sp. LEGE 00249]MBD2135551.1 UPF0175 family protein [Sphaerospermopsis sp. FACHB-1094]MBD2146844.1 UPF0175 family protein [Sphaerospermopsis sp. FACHB-1194]MBE9238336.1 UPF0175 family protein [Sphaerospermopsis aphanizomenoides LEGE 00250]